MSEAYYAFLKEHKRDHEKEYDLARKWEHAAVLLGKYDSSLSERLDAKSEYWRAGGTWSEDAVQKAGIGLERIKKEVDDRLTTKKRT